MLAVGSRLQDFTTGSWTVFGEGTRIIGLNVARFDATKHLSQPLVADAREGLSELNAQLGGWVVQPAWADRARTEHDGYLAFVAERTAPGGEGPPTYAQVIGAVNRLAGTDDCVSRRRAGCPGR